MQIGFRRPATERWLRDPPGLPHHPGRKASIVAGLFSQEGAVVTVILHKLVRGAPIGGRVHLNVRRIAYL